MLVQVEATGIGSFWATNAEGNLIYLSKNAAQSLGDGADRLLDLPVTKIFCEVDDDNRDHVATRSLGFLLISRAKIDNHIVEIDISPRSENDKNITRWWRISGRPFYDNEVNFFGYRGNCSDITREFQQQQNINRHSQYDELTGLANRRRINGRLKTLLSAFQASGRSCALMMLDLDRFKAVNDTMGHPAGGCRPICLLKQVCRWKSWGQVHIRCQNRRMQSQANPSSNNWR